MGRFLRVASIALLLVASFNAVVAGALFIADPSGGRLGLTTSYLERSPFETFLVPGLVLFGAVGLVGLNAAWLTIVRAPRHEWWVMAHGVLLAGWIVVQVAMVHDLNALHVVMFAIGAALLGCGAAALRQAPALAPT